MPALIVTVIVLSGLWMTDVYSRLNLGLTGLLTVIAIQVNIEISLTLYLNCTWIYLITISPHLLL